MTRANAKPSMTVECYTCKPRDQAQRIYYIARQRALPLCREKGHQIGPVKKLQPLFRCYLPQGEDGLFAYVCTLLRGHAGDHNRCIDTRRQP